MFALQLGLVDAKDQLKPKVTKSLFKTPRTILKIKQYHIHFNIKLKTLV